MTTSVTTESDQLPSQPLPFSIDERSFFIWLGQVEKQDELELLQLLTGVLNQLKQSKIPADIRSVFLGKLSVLVFKISTQLQKTYLDSYFPFSVDDTLKIDLSMRCAFEMAENYALICKDTSFKLKAIFSSEQKSKILLNSIQAMSKILLYKAIIYEKPGKGFWSLCFLFYLFAKQNEVLELTSSQWQVTFINVFKQLVVFELSNTQQFNTKEIYTIYNLLNNLSEQVRLLPTVPEKMIHSVPCFNLRVDAAPAVSNNKQAAETSYQFYISSLNLVKQLFDLSAHKKNCSYSDKVLIFRLIKTLTVKHVRKNERKLADNELLAEVGYDKFVDFLLHKESLLKTKGVISYEIRDLSIDEAIEKNERDEVFGLRTELDASLSLAVNSEDVVEDIDNADIWGTKQKKKEEVKDDDSDTNANLIDQSKLGFCLKLKEKGVVTKVGDVIHLFICSVSVVAIIRRIISTDGQGVVVGVEVLGYNAELLHIMDIDNKGPRMACILVNIDGVESIVIKADDFLNEEHLYVDRNEKILRYKIEKILDSSTSMVKHLKVCLS